MGPTLKLHVIEGGGGEQASCLVAKQTVDSPQVLASILGIAKSLQNPKKVFICISSGL